MKENIYLKKLVKKNLPTNLLLTLLLLLRKKPVGRFKG